MLKKKTLFFMLVISTILIISAAVYSQSQPNEPTPPKIMVTVNGKVIDYVVGINKWDGAVYDRLDTFHTIMKVDSGIEIPYVELGEIIKIEFMENAPAKTKLYDALLKRDGSNKYTDRETIDVPVKFVNGKFSFTFEPQMASNLSSNSADYLDGNTLRGFGLICTWGENECEYAFVIRTDAR